MLVNRSYVSYFALRLQGAPEIVIKKCGRYFYRGKEHVIDEDFVEDMMEAYNSFGALAERVIGHAFKVHPDSILIFAVVWPFVGFMCCV